MAKDFDIYLRSRLHECDLIVYSIPYHDGVSATDRLILEAALNGYILQKIASVQMETKLTAHIDEMIKLCLEKLNIGTAVDASAEIEIYSRLCLDGTPLVIDAHAVEMLGRVMNEVDSGLFLCAQSLDTQVALSAGRTDSPLVMDTGLARVSKQSMLRIYSDTILQSELVGTHQQDFIGGTLPVVSETTLQSLCYQLTFSASAAVEIMALVLGTEIHHSLGRWYNGIAIGSKLTGAWAQKFEIAQTVATILQEATGVLIKVLYPDRTGTVLHSRGGCDLKRCRLLNEIYSDGTVDKVLDDIGDMTLDELYYVWIT